jgi:hypothetical protein
VKCTREEERYKVKSRICQEMWKGLSREMEEYGNGRLWKGIIEKGREGKKRIRKCRLRKGWVKRKIGKGRIGKD